MKIKIRFKLNLVRNQCILTLIIKGIVHLTNWAVDLYCMPWDFPKLLKKGASNAL